VTGIEGRCPRMCGISLRVSRRVPVGSRGGIWHPTAGFASHRLFRVALFGSSPDR
jgi:hypothetical protein